MELFSKRVIVFTELFFYVSGRLNPRRKNMYNIAFPNFNIYLNINKIAFSIGNIHIYWYGIIITFSIVLDFIILSCLVKRFKYNEDLPFDLIFAAVLPGIIGARLFSVVFEESSTILDFFDSDLFTPVSELRRRHGRQRRPPGQPMPGPWRGSFRPVPYP